MSGFPRHIPAFPGMVPVSDRRPSAPAARWRRSLVSALTVAVAVAPPAVLAWQAWGHRWVAEDAFIYFRVVQHLLDGDGPVFNEGERIEVYTGPLWLGLLAGATAVLESVPLEWIAVGLGLSLSVAGLLAAQQGALALARAEGRLGIAVPLGALVVGFSPPYWDFATSGLETGLTFAWLGAGFWGLGRLHAATIRDACGDGRPRAPAWLAVFLGLGPLIRPDLAVFSAGFLLLLGIVAPPARVRSVRLLVAAAALPAAYQVFRMGYFAALVPNPALAKSAFDPHWAQGWRYLGDFAGTYWLWVPLSALLGWWLLDVAALWRDRRGRGVALATAPVAAGVVHGLYIVRLGGDFMHARLLLPSLFAVVLPVAVVVVRRRALLLTAGAVIVPWAIACVLWLDVPYEGIGPDGITDEREHYADRSRNPAPVTLADYGLHRFTVEGHGLRQLAWEGRALLFGMERAALTDRTRQAPLGPRVRANVVVSRDSIGITGYAAGPRVHVVDRHGLADSIAARLELPARGRPGHEKFLSDEWLIGRFGDPSQPLPRRVAGEARGIEAARMALSCPPLRELLDAVAGRLTVARFVRNMGLAWRFHRLTIPADPHAAAALLCPADPDPGGRP